MTSPRLCPMRLAALVLLAAAPAAVPAVAQTVFSSRDDFATGLSRPRSVVQLADGRVLVADASAGRISAYPASGGTPAVFADGLAEPTSVTQLADGRVLVAEYQGGRISAFPAAGGTRTDFATGLSGPWGVTQLADGRVLVTEPFSNRISAYPVGGGARTDFATGLSRPWGVAQLADGRVLVAESVANRVSAFAAAGGPRADFATGLAGPQGVTQLADGRVLVAEPSSNRVSAFPTGGGTRTDFATGLSSPQSVTQLADGCVLVAEPLGGRVSVFTPLPPSLQARFGPRVDFAAGLGGPQGVVQLADGRVLVAETTAGRVSVYLAGGGTRADFAVGLTTPVALTQLADGRVLVVEKDAGRVSAFPRAGGARTDFATDIFPRPQGVTQLSDGRVLVTQPLGGRVSAFPSTGGEQTDFATGLGQPHGVTQLADGRVLVAELSQSRVSAFAASGGARSDFATGLAQPLDVTQLADGRVLVAQFGASRITAFPATGGVRLDVATGLSGPHGLTQLEDGRVLVADADGRVRQLAPAGGPVAVTEARVFNPSAAPGDGAGWRLLGAPVAGLDVADLAALNLVQGVAAGSDPATHPAQYPLAGGNVFTAYNGDGTYAAPDADDPLTPGRGFFWYLYDLDIPASTGFGGGTSVSRELTGFALAAFGPQAEADVSLDVAGNADNFYLLANPFARPFAVSGLSASGGTLQGGVVQAYDPAGGSFVVRMGADRLAPWQGAFAELVPTVPGGTVAVTYAFAATDDAASPVFVGRSAAAQAEGPSVRFALAGTLASGAAVRDEAAVVRFVGGAAAGWDALDVSKLTPPGARHALVAPVLLRDGEPHRAAVDSRPVDAAAVPVAFASTEAGAFRLSWTAALPEGWTATLTDAETGVTTDVRLASEVSFATAAAQAWTERFTLSVTPDRATATEGGAAARFGLEVPRPNPARGSAQVAFSLAEAGAARVSVVDLLGREVSVLVDGARSAGAHAEALDASRLAPGVYVVRLVAGGAVRTQRLVVVR